MRHPLHRLVRLTLLAAMAAGCQPPSPPDDALASLSGEVTDQLSGAPLAGVELRLSGAELRFETDRDGRFEVAAPPGERTLFLAAEEHLAGSRRHVLLEPRRETHLALTLFPSQPTEQQLDDYLRERELRRPLRDDPDDPALRPEARRLLLEQAASPSVIGPGVTEPRVVAPVDDTGVGSVRAALGAPPSTIRIWRRSIDGADSSCAGRIDVIDFEDYVAGVLPHEWIPSWHDESLRAGSLAIRTYSWRWVDRGGKYDCADLDDTARSQVYRDDRTERASAAVDLTRGMVITSDGELVSGEYSAENSDPTAFGVDEPLCTGRELFGHGRGMCQWGSQRWANDGRDHLWIAEHYYPGGVVEGAGPALPDFDADAARIADAPSTLRSGERAQVTVELTNIGRRSWESSEVRLATAEISPFYDEENWLDSTTATPPDAPPYPTSSVGRFTFRITAPVVSAPTSVTETFQLVNGSDGTPFGPTVELTILVTPRDGVVAPLDAGADASDAGTPPEETPGGCSCSIGARSSSGAGWLGLLGLLGAVWRRRRA